VDYLVVASNNSDAIYEFKEYMSIIFHMKNLGALKYFLGIKIIRELTGLFLCRRKYVMDMLAQSKLLSTKPTGTLIEQNHHLAESNCGI
jgi:Reverse transcriptase (RNA-dependent DNA polymerase)